MKRFESMQRQYFALGSDGFLYALGDCGDFESADIIADDMGINALWILDYSTARQFQSVINSKIGEAQ